TAGTMSVAVAAGGASDALGQPNTAGGGSQAFDTAPPTQRVASFSVVDNVGPVQGPIASGGTTDDPTPGITLTLDAVLGAGDVLTLSRGGGPIRTLTSGSTLTFTDTLPERGGHLYVASITDAAGNTSVLDLNGPALGTGFGLTYV
ncbi:MAG TPA: hypothetical protein VEA81_16720, partial [Burkholderiaceae bacterium]|nr:hypothetical protein [Burkholderiaceae bacterium]